jgi:hypothetical protein
MQNRVFSICALCTGVGQISRFWYNQETGIKNCVVNMSDLLMRDMWVNTTEAAEITGYHFEYVRKLARDNWNIPENDRVIRVRRRSNRYDIWLPDLIKYMQEHGYGPYPKRQTSS